MRKKSGRILLIAAVLFACWLQYPVGMHIKETIPGVTATCAETGLTEGKKCKLCGKLVAAQEVIPATGLHIYDDDFDKSCNYCSYIREVNNHLGFANHRVVLRDENKNHKNWKVTVYKLGKQTVEDPADEEALQAIDSTANTYLGIEEINKILLTDAGNYVVLLKYNIGANVTKKVPMALTITDDPKLIVDEDNRITVIDNNAANKNHILTVFNLGETKIVDPDDETAVKNAAIRTETYAGISTINETTITLGGNYVFYLHYDAADGTKQTITLAEKLESHPALRIDEENKLVAFSDDETLTHFRAFVYRLGDKTVEDIYNAEKLEKVDGDPVVYWGLERINKVVLKESGNYVIHLFYNIETGAKEVVALKVTV